MFLVADASQREELAKQFLTRLPLTEDHAEWRVVLNAIELLIQQGNQEVNSTTAVYPVLGSLRNLGPTQDQ